MSKVSIKDKVQLAFTDGSLLNIIHNSDSLATMAIKLGYSTHGRNTKVISDFIRANNLNYNSTYRRTKELVSKICLHCGKAFVVSINDKQYKNKLVCSHACSNAYPPYIENRVNAKLEIEATTYSLVAKRAGYTSCCICGENEVIDIHHLDEDRSNNSVDNLVALCPTHHAYLHRGKSHLVMDKLVVYLDTREVS